MKTCAYYASVTRSFTYDIAVNDNANLYVSVLIIAMRYKTGMYLFPHISFNHAPLKTFGAPIFRGFSESTA